MIDKEKFEELKKNVVEQTTFKANRIPEKTKKEIVEWADREFCSDRGMALKWLWDYYKGDLVTESSEQNKRIDLIADEVGKLKDLVLQERHNKVAGIAADGKEIRIGGKEDERKKT